MRNSLANWIGGAVLLVCLLLVGATVWQGEIQRERSVQGFDVSMRNLSRSLVQYAEDSLEIADTAIAGIAEDVQRSEWSQRFLDDLHHRMAEQVTASGRLRALFVYDAEGRWVASSLDSIPAKGNNSDRTYFRYHRSTRSSRPFIASPVRSHSSGEWIITLTRRFDKSDGSFGGVVLASIDATHFTGFFDNFDVGSQGAITLLNDRGIVLSSWPDLERTIGQDRFEDASFKAPVGSPSNWTSHYTSILDGSERIAGSSRGSRYGLVVTASLSRDEALSSNRGLFRTQLLLVGAFVLVFCLAGFQVVRQVKNRQAAEQRLRTLSETDALTGLANRRSLQFRIEEWRRENRAFTLLLIDLDRFKTVNDTHGHGIGDELLIQVAVRLTSVAGPGDFAARLGGDEMAVLVPDGPEDAQSCAERIVAEIARPFAIAGAILDIGCSIGLSRSKDARNATELMQQADLALYDAKNKGRSQVAPYRQGMMEALAEQHRLGSDLRRALEAGQFHLVYQPIRSLRENRRIGAEALIRWEHPTLGPISPASFIPLAEESGQIAAIGQWVLEEACRVAAGWPDDQYVAVNVSPVQCRSPLLLAHVTSALAKSGLPAHRLEIELTETAMTGNGHDISEMLATLRTLGIRIAMDDFGTGFSSLSRLCDLPLDRIKIDRSFIAAAETDRHSLAVIVAVTQMCRTLEIGALVEGVETPGQLRLLEELGCEAAQGYLLGRPAPDPMSSQALSAIVA